MIAKQNCLIAIASKNGTIPAIHFLITNFKTPPEKILRLCFVVAARRGHVHVLCYLMDGLKQWPSSVYLEKMICAAAEHGHIAVITLIMERFEKTKTDVQKWLGANNLLRSCPDSVRVFIDSA